MSEKLERPPLTCTIKLEDESEQTVKLTYGLFQDLQRAIPQPEQVIDVIAADPYTRDYVIRRCLTDTKKLVTDPEKELIPADEVKLDDPDEIDKLLQWIVGHILYFFATSAGGLKRLSEVFKTKLGADLPAPSINGSQS